MEPPHNLGRLNIDRILVAECALLNAENEAEILNVIGKVTKWKSNRSALFEVVKLKGLEITYQDMTRKLVFFEAGKIVERLLFGLCKVEAAAFLLDQQHAFPKEVDAPAFVVGKILDRGFETCHPPAAHAEDVEEVIVESLGVAAFVALAMSFLGELGGGGTDFIPGKSHSRLQIRWN